MSRLALACEYDGTDFVGWQAQANGRSVQAALAEAISAVADEPVGVHGAGRTDAGVHADCQIAHFDTRAARTPRQWLLGINSNLPDDVSVQAVVPVPASFDARRSALWREYRYTIACRQTRPAQDRRFVWWLRDTLDCDAMTAAASAWLGERDFSAFRAAQCQSTTPMRRMLGIAIAKAPDRLELRFRANAFLYHMVRNLVGAMVAIGRGEQPVAWARELIASRDRSRGAATAPAQGLSLAAVGYPESFGVPIVPIGVRPLSGSVPEPERGLTPSSTASPTPSAPSSTRKGL
ncbi:MAG TPA: tRNA pseudouridine(38-40) synthase TruA [Gammaproteobacteria bacterium]|nr:tRNA pseudouridine(38-40) synthase TruA [Gammaproteobacteria bacterium]